jgi:D-tyrosyl-tRNA(Tyr) deacylase
LLALPALCNVFHMKGLVQRVSRAAVTVDGELVGAVGPGITVFVGVGHDDTEADADLLADRIVGLRIFADDDGRMNRSLLDVGGELLVVSQFTLMGDTRRGRRPSFVAAAEPARAEQLVERVVTAAAEGSGVSVATGRFGAHMEIDIQADGPVTLMLDTKQPRRSKDKTSKDKEASAVDRPPGA